MTARFSSVSAGVLALALALAGCEPASVTAARDQLGRGGSRTYTLTLPMTLDTFLIGKFLSTEDTATTPDGLLAVRIDPVSLASAVGQKLQFSNLAFQTFRFSYGQMLTAKPDSATLSVTFAPRLSAPFGPIYLDPPTVRPDTIRYTTPQGSSVAAGTMASGLIIGRITNGTACTVTVTDTLRDSTGAAVVAFRTMTVPPNETRADTVDAAGVSFRGYIFLGTPAVTPGGACTPATGTVVAVRLKTTTLTLQSVTLRNVNEVFTQTDSILANEPRITALDTVVVYSGSFTITAQNRLPIGATATILLNGVTRGGTPLTTTLVLPAAPGDGSTRTASTTLNLSGAVIRPAAVVASVTGVATAATATISGTVTTDAIVVDGGGSLVLQSVSGRLDPARTPELSVPVEEYREIQRSQVDRFGDLEDAVRSARINSAPASLTIWNTAQTPLALSSVRLGVVRLNTLGQMLRDAGGNPAFERDSVTNLPILVTLAPAGQTTLTVPRAGTATLSLEMGPLVNRLVHLLLGDVRTAVVASGSAVAGDGSLSRITRGDSAAVEFRMTVGLDISLPDTGIVFTRVEYADGADLEPRDSASVVSRLLSAVASSELVNGTPFAMTVDLALARDSVPGTTDIFALPGRVLLGPVTVAGSPVDATGRVTTPATSSQSITLTGADARALLGRRFTTGVRIRLRPPPGGTGRGAVRATDRLVVRSHARVELRAGGGQ
jgi:hypothetical protein